MFEELSKLAIAQFVKTGESHERVMQAQFDRMIDLTRTAANVYTGLVEAGDKKPVLLLLTLTELEALAQSHGNNKLVDRFVEFRAAIEGEKSHREVAKQEQGLLTMLHKLERKRLKT